MASGLIGTVMLLVAVGLWIYKRSENSRATSATHADSHHFRWRPAERANMVTRWPIHRLQLGPRLQMDSGIGIEEQAKIAAQRGKKVVGIRG